MRRKIEWIAKQIRHYTEMLDRAVTLAEIGKAIRMRRLYENALLRLGEE